IVCFFFQAEDGIRDRNVTGVQTCALPIFMIFFAVSSIRPISQSTVSSHPGRPFFMVPATVYASRAPSSISLAVANARASGVISRSEERRVGKEGRLWRAE